MRSPTLNGKKIWTDKELESLPDDGNKYDEANALTRQAQEKIASAEGKST